MYILNLLFHTHGKISRSEWWLSQIGLWIGAGITSWVWHKYGLHDAIYGMVGTIIMFWMRISVNIKRWHDRGRPTWWAFALEIPLVLSGIGFIFNVFLGIAGLVLAGITWIWGFIELGILPSKITDEHTE